MATRRELRGYLKQSQRTSEIADAPLPSNLKSTGQASGTENEIRVRSKRSSHSRKERVKEHKDDELVKYMSKLPGYLQRMESGEESVQSHVLNVGVLDWGRLEKWKHGRKRGAERSGKTIATASTSGVVPNDQERIFPNLGKGKASRDLQHSVRCTLEPELASRDSLNKQEIATCSYKSSGRDHLGAGKSRRPASSTSGLLSDMGNSGGSLGTKETQKRAGMIHAQEARERATESVEDLDGEEKIIGDMKAGLASGEQEIQISNIFLLRSRKHSGSTLSGESQSQMPLDDNMRRVAREVTRSLDLSEGINSSLELTCSQIPRSCPLSIDLERDSQDRMLAHGVDNSGKKERFGGRIHSKTVIDQEMREDESGKSRHHSPSKRFSFSFGRLSRSFSSKEDSADNIIKSDSMRFDGSVCPSQSGNTEEQCGSRVSPLRRLLLKSKGSENTLPSKARSSSKPTNIDVPLQDEKKQDASRTRALFQLTVRNGIPLFQFVVDDNNSNKKKKKSSRSVLGATMKSSASSLKEDDTVRHCTFYSVKEAEKKKSGSWLIHGHKEKQGGFVYNVIGQMRLSSSDITENKSGNNTSPVVAESVLFDGSEQVIGRREVAAVVIKKKPVEEATVIIPGGVHSFPEKGAPTPLISRWRSGGICDCGGWDVGCKIHILSNKSLLSEFDQSFKLYDQGGSEDESGPALEMTELKTGIYRVEFGSFLSHLQAFFVCVTVITCASEEEPVSKATGKSSSPFAPPLSPVGRA
ncbi:unnamed protein product [Microthlaspi erraticum]|uniref:DUF3527 domain-containing protein n=1 Tax=Microthlaspi erraticum TaxID=1685480 RepID=A0A6D2L571_9BRAS|nr:unnamed protein product [Microthlaspi erraticum]